MHAIPLRRHGARRRSPVCANPLHGQLGPPSTGGAVAAEHARRMLGHNKRVLIIGAHPDDEDTDLITVLVRGEGAEAAYLSLNRGEGGQNLIGPELGEALGLLRTEELLSARSLDGGRQYFTRAYDFGFSKTLDDTWQHWPRDSILKDVVRVIRRFRPQIIVSVFSGTPGDGHGQHQAAGWAAQARRSRRPRDPPRFPELAREEGLPAVARRQALPRGALHAGRRHVHDPDRRARPGGRPVVSPDRHGEPQPAPVAGHGRAPDAGAGVDPDRAGRRTARAPATRSGRASTRRSRPGPRRTSPSAALVGSASHSAPRALANERGLVLDAVASTADLVPGPVCRSHADAVERGHRARSGRSSASEAPQRGASLAGIGDRGTRSDGHRRRYDRTPGDRQYRAVLPAPSAPGRHVPLG